MGDNNENIIKLKLERTELINKLNKLEKLKYNNTDEYLKLGGMMCQLLDTQQMIMKSYIEILTARIILLEVDYNE